VNQGVTGVDFLGEGWSPEKRASGEGQTYRVQRETAEPQEMGEGKERPGRVGPQLGGRDLGKKKKGDVAK